MVVYEVNLCLDQAIYPEFITWLEKHIDDMLKFPGFIQARLLKQTQDRDNKQEKLTVQYQIKTQHDLENYLTQFAPQMQAEGIQRFKNQFSATRRFFRVLR